MHLNNCNSYNLLKISIKGFVNEFFINTHLKYLLNQKITNILWNARASITFIVMFNQWSVYPPMRSTTCPYPGHWRKLKGCQGAQRYTRRVCTTFSDMRKRLFHMTSNTVSMLPPLTWTSPASGSRTAWRVWNWYKFQLLQVIVINNYCD